jgi:FAD/FMN-containing dehydrogenase
VGAVVRAATAAGLRVAPQSTGHNAGPLALRGLDDVVIVRMSRMIAVSVNPETRIARVEGGAVWLPVVEAAGEHGLAALHGSSPDVGIAGYSLGGGIGWYARKLGWPPTASPPSSWSSPTAAWSAPTPPRTRSCSGPCAVVEATSES